MLGTLHDGYGRQVQARTVTYRDAASGSEVSIHHAQVGGLAPGTEYLYAALHDGATPQPGLFRTAPRGRAPFTFTSFGDQGTPTLGKLYTPPAGVTLPSLPTSTTTSARPPPATSWPAWSAIAPLFHLVNGDLCYANLATDRVRTWSDWFTNNSRSARFRPWMPAAGNHENELGNGPIGYGAYQSYFALPDVGGDAETQGLWYAFTVGIGPRDQPEQRRRVLPGRRQLLRARVLRRCAEALARSGAASVPATTGRIDWIVVVMHQVVISTVDNFNGADRGIREEWVPLFDKYGVDLVVCGHEHHYERSHPIRGQQPSDTLTPIPVDTRTDVVDTSRGTVHMVLGGGGTSAPSNALFFDPARAG